MNVHYSDMLSIIFSLLLSVSAVSSDKVNCDSEVTNLWRVNTNPPSYFFGTIHVPYNLVWDGLSENVMKAFIEAENVYFELDLRKG